MFYLGVSFYGVFLGKMIFYDCELPCGSGANKVTLHRNHKKYNMYKMFF